MMMYFSIIISLNSADRDLQSRTLELMIFNPTTMLLLSPKVTTHQNLSYKRSIDD